MKSKFLKYNFKIIYKRIVLYFFSFFFIKSDISSNFYSNSNVEQDWRYGCMK